MQSGIRLTRKEAFAARKDAFAAKATTYYGKVCEKHPQLDGLRRTYSNRCVDCHLVRRTKQRTRYNHRRHTDPIFRLRDSLRRKLRDVLRRVNQKKSTRTFDLVGCTLAFLKAYIEKQFLPGMSWANYGEWHVDHIRPCASFDLTEVSEQRKCFHYTNLQPLWGPDNMSKGSMYDGRRRRYSDHSPNAPLALPAPSSRASMNARDIAS